MDATVVGRVLGALELTTVEVFATKRINKATNFFLGISLGKTSYTAQSYKKAFDRKNKIIFPVIA